MTKKEVRSLRLAYDGVWPIEGLPDNPTQAQLADHFSISESYCQQVCAGLYWSEVNPPKCTKVTATQPKKRTGRRRFNEEEEGAIRLAHTSLNVKELAKQYECSPTTIRKVLNET